MFTDIIGKLIGLGLPVLGTALGGPLGGAVASIIAKALGAPDASPGTLSTTISTTPNDVLIQKLKSAQDEYIAMVKSESDIAQTQIKSVGETIQAEVAAGSKLTGWSGTFVTFLQVSWRPIFAYETIFECAVGALLVFHEFWTGDISTSKAILEYSGFLQWYFGLKFGLLGVYSWGRTKEKVEGADSNVKSTPSSPVLKAVLDTIKGRLGQQ